MKFTENLNWRHATRTFDPHKKVSPQNLQKILDATRLAPTSFGLQPFHVVLVNDPALREKIFQAGWKQPQYTTAAELMVFCSRSDISTRITEFLEICANGNAAARERLKGYEAQMRGALGKLSEAELHVWASRQAYIALGFAMAACAELNVDSCPMEGFSPTQIDQVLELPAHMKSSVMLAIGFRLEGTPVRPKVRFPESDFFSRK